MSFPSFDGFRREDAVATKTAKRDKAGGQDVMARHQVAKDVSQAALMLAAAEKNVEASRKGLEQTEEQFRIIQEQ